MPREFQSKGGDVKPKMNLRVTIHQGETRPETGPKAAIMINLSSFIAFHARRHADRCALKYRGEEVSYAEFRRAASGTGGWLATRE